LDPPVSSNSKPIQNKPGTDSALTPHQNPSITSSPIPRKRGRPAGPGAGVIPIEYQQKKPEIQTTDSEKLVRVLNEFGDVLFLSINKKGMAEPREKDYKFSKAKLPLVHMTKIIKCINFNFLDKRRAQNAGYDCVN
jgi:hypothetical protein